MKIEHGVIYYNIRQQDDTLVEMTVADTLNMRLFVAWVEKHDGHDDVTPELIKILPTDHEPQTEQQCK